MQPNPKTAWDACPVILLYRQSVELHLKALVDEGCNFLPSPTDPISLYKTHSLRWLAQIVCQIVKTVQYRKLCGGAGPGGNSFPRDADSTGNLSSRPTGEGWQSHLSLCEDQPLCRASGGRMLRGDWSDGTLARSLRHRRLLIVIDCTCLTLAGENLAGSQNPCDRQFLAW
jgi:hypothetical protein